MNNFLPHAPLETIRHSDRTYIGAVPRYRAHQPEPHMPIVWIKTHKGVPFRREHN